MKFINDAPGLIEHVLDILNERNRHEHVFSEHVTDVSNMSAVLFLLGLKRNENGVRTWGIK